ncbi:MAG: aminotransferase class IV [Arcobacteraceae bacterium]|nr:aminotransferase class IV [Arcobacteraceae bacterium]
MTYFETIKCEDEEVFNLDYHQKRIAKTVGLNIDLREYIYPPNNKLLKCKIIYDENGILDISFTVYKQKEINTFKLVVSNTIDYKYKSTNREDLENLFNQKENANEIIIIRNGLITDTSIANIAVFDGNYWLTPKLPLLEGTCRNRLIDEGKIIEKDITIQQLLEVKKIALMNAMIDFKIIDNFDIINKNNIL